MASTREYGYLEEPVRIRRPLPFFCSFKMFFLRSGGTRTLRAWQDKRAHPLFAQVFFCEKGKAVTLSDCVSTRAKLQRSRVISLDERMHI